MASTRTGTASRARAPTDANPEAAACLTVASGSLRMSAHSAGTTTAVGSRIRPTPTAAHRRTVGLSSDRAARSPGAARSAADPIS